MSRDAILSQIRAALKIDRADADRSETVARRLLARRRYPAPSGAAGDALVARFIGNLAQQLAVSVVRSETSADVPAAIVAYLGAHSLSRIRCGSDPRLACLALEKGPALVLSRGPAEAEDEAALSHAEAGVAETGTLVLVSGAENPTSLAFLPDTHLVAVCEDTIVGCYEDAFDMLRSHSASGPLPRTVNLVSGPSRTGDIGGRIVFGAHGPRRLAVFIYGRDQA